MEERRRGQTTQHAPAVRSDDVERTGRRGLRQGGPARGRASLLELQRLAGNTAVTRLLTGRQTWPEAPRAERVHGHLGVVTIQRAGGGAPATATAAKAERTPEQIERLIADVLRVIVEMEVGGADKPVTESSYDTSSGTRASYRSRVQATLVWTLDLLGRHKELRDKFGLTTDELATAKECAAAVKAVWQAVMALPAGTTLDQAKADRTVSANLSKTGLDDADLERMRKFGAWRSEVITGLPERPEHIAELNKLSTEELAAQATAKELKNALAPANKRALAEWRKEKAKDKKKRPPPAATVADLTDQERQGLAAVVGDRQVVERLAKAGAGAGIGIGERSAARYVAEQKKVMDTKRGKPHWGEDQAAWLRYAVEKSLPQVGAKMKQAAEDDEGMTLGRMDVKDRVAALIGNKSNKALNDEELAWKAFKAHNADEKYADKALPKFKAIHVVEPAPKAQ
ncbi:hypothetical protein [Streptomyces sp. NPDC000618]|uniref:hypothetical protein n=1 Tax=Streptomyces sp. NPDC000618 TaxID=3154265 RepID=UPI003320872E